MSYQKPRSGEQAPVISEEISNGGSVQTKVNHPAFGQISVSRRNCSGGGMNLYDSDFGHNSYVSIAIKRSELYRDLSRDWHFPKEELIHIDMSESQWATFVSSFNSGSGTPCTLTWLPNEGKIPGIPSFDRSEVFKKEMKQANQEAVDGLKSLISSIKDSGLSKKKQEELLSDANKTLRALTSSIPFVNDQFEEHVENTVERGMQEIHGYINAAVNRAGIKAINGSDFLKLENQTEE